MVLLGPNFNHFFEPPTASSRSFASTATGKTTDFL
jgi:hypothetical protein